MLTLPILALLRLAHHHLLRFVLDRRLVVVFVGRFRILPDDRGGLWGLLGVGALVFTGVYDKLINKVAPLIRKLLRC